MTVKQSDPRSRLVGRIKNLSLRAKLVIAFLVITFITIGVLAYWNNQTAQSNLTQAANQALLSGASQTAVRLDEFITTNLALVRTQAQLPIFSEYLELPEAEHTGSHTEADVATALQTMVRRDQIFINSYALLNRQGINIIDSNGINIGLDESNQDYFQEAFQKGQPYISPVRLAANNRLGLIHFSAPIRNRTGEIVGVLRFSFDANVLQNIVSHNNELIGPESFAILLDENHIRLAHGTQPDLIFKSVVPFDQPTTTQLQAASRLPNLPLTELSTNIPKFEQGLNNSDEQPFFTTPLVATQDNLASVAAIQMETRPWFVMFAQPQDVYLAPISRQTEVTLILAAALAVVVALASLGIARLLTGPIIRLTETAVQIKEGNLAAQAQIESNDEIGLLATTFNDMTTQLRETLQGLEQRVANRTRALEISMDVGRRLSTILDEKQLVTEVVEQVRGAFDYYYAHIYIFDETKETLVMAGGTGEAGRILLERGHTLAKGQGLVGRAAETNTSVLVQDVSQEEGWLPNPLLPDTKAEVAVPIAVGDEVLGVLDVQHNVAGGLTPSAANLIQSIANQAAIALRNARAYSRAQHQAEREVLANTISQQIQSATTVDQAMQIAVRELGRALGKGRTKVRLNVAAPEHRQN